ncbi:glycosyltransferase, partial [uncultured Thermus sp.]|uniref:glycosyltransferase n=1 Tax=uncultured Thermus sp. TaxID=157149 RepID=UPI00260D9DDE
LKLVMVGDGPLRAEVEREVRDWGIGERVLLLGAREAREVLPAFDVLLMTSRYEGFPYVVLEAFALSIPIVSAPTPGLGEWLREHGALVAEKAHPDALAAALEKALLAHTQPPTWNQEWSSERMVEKTLALYQTIL